MRLLITIFLSAISISLTLACSFPVYDFCQSIDTFPDRNILTGHITQLDSNGINLEVLHVLRGEETRTNVRIWDRQNWQCNGPFHMSAEVFVNLGDTIIMMLPRIDSIQETWDVVGDYAWPRLHFFESLYEVHNDELFIGEHNFLGGLSYPTSINYSFFVNAWLDNHACDRIVDTQDLTKTQKLTLYPNPALDEINIVGHNNERPISYTLFDIAGKHISSNVSKTGGQDIPIAHLRPGVYFIRLEGENQSLKFVKL